MLQKKKQVSSFHSGRYIYTRVETQAGGEDMMMDMRHLLDPAPCWELCCQQLLLSLFFYSDLELCAQAPVL